MNWNWLKWLPLITQAVTAVESTVNADGPTKQSKAIGLVTGFLNIAGAGLTVKDQEDIAYLVDATVDVFNTEGTFGEVKATKKAVAKKPVSLPAWPLDTSPKAYLKRYGSNARHSILAEKYLKAA